MPHLATGLLKGGQHGQDVGVVYPPQGHAAAGDGGCRHVGGGNDAVGHDTVLGAEKLFDAVDDDAALPCPVDAAATAV